MSLDYFISVEERCDPLLNFLKNEDGAWVDVEILLLMWRLWLQVFILLVYGCWLVYRGIV